MPPTVTVSRLLNYVPWSMFCFSSFPIDSVDSFDLIIIKQNVDDITRRPFPWFDDGIHIYIYAKWLYIFAWLNQSMAPSNYYWTLSQNACFNKKNQLSLHNVLKGIYEYWAHYSKFQINRSRPYILVLWAANRSFCAIDPQTTKKIPFNHDERNGNRRCRNEWTDNMSSLLWIRT